jgi:hypothetical protein
MSFAGKWMELEMIMLREINHTEKANRPCSVTYVVHGIQTKRTEYGGEKDKMGELFGGGNQREGKVKGVLHINV